MSYVSLHEDIEVAREDQRHMSASSSRKDAAQSESARTPTASMKPAALQLSRETRLEVEIARLASRLDDRDRVIRALRGALARADRALMQRQTRKRRRQSRRRVR